MSFNKFGLLLWLALCGPMPNSFAAPEGIPKGRDAQIQYIPGLPDDDCRSNNGKREHAHCKANEQRVRIAPVYDNKGRLMGCVAMLGYNTLRVHTSKDKEAVTVTYVAANTGTYFFDDGMEVKGKDGLLEAGSPEVIDKGQRVTLKIKANADVGKEFDHQPKIKWRTNNQTFTCLGVDPVIINQAD